MDAVLTAADFSDFGGTAPPRASRKARPTAPSTSTSAATWAPSARPARTRSSTRPSRERGQGVPWSDWNKGSSTHDNPESASAFLNLRFRFFDENKVWRSISASRLLDHESKLRYSYGPAIESAVLPRLLEWVEVQPPRPFQRTLAIDARLRETLAKAVTSQAQVRIHFDGLQVPVDKSAVYSVYADVREAEAARGRREPGLHRRGARRAQRRQERASRPHLAQRRPADHSAGFRAAQARRSHRALRGRQRNEARRASAPGPCPRRILVVGTGNEGCVSTLRCGSSRPARSESAPSSRCPRPRARAPSPFGCPTAGARPIG